MDDLDFSDLKKKKKKTSKKAAFDLEAFEKELGDAPPEPEEVEEGGGEDEGDLGDDPFAVQDGPAPTAMENGREPWLGSDRDYTYSEVSPPKLFSFRSFTADIGEAPSSVFHFVTRLEPSSPLRIWKKVHYCSTSHPTRRFVN